MQKTSIFITGVGGQGSLLASKIIAKAAANAGLNVLMSEVHGMAQRGGVVESTVRIGDVHSPIIRDGDADILLGFELAESLRALRKASRKTTILTSVNTIIPITVSLNEGEYPDPEKALEDIMKTGKKVYSLNSEALAEKAGNMITSNIVMLGALGGSGLLPFEERFLREAVKESVPSHAVEVNERAYGLGRAAIPENEQGE